MLNKLHIILFTLFIHQGVTSQVGLNSLVFNGTSDYYSVPDNSSIDSSANFTLEAWINPCDTVGHKMILAKQWCSGGQFSYYFSFLNGKLKWLWNSNGGCGGATGSTYESTNRIIRNNIWQHVAVVHTSSSISMYYNGVLVAGSLLSGSYGAIYNSNQPLRAGTYRGLSGAYGAYFNGRIDEIRVWNTALSGSQILARKNISLVGNEPNLVLYHNFDTDTNINIQNKAVSSGTTNNGLTTSLSPYFLSNNSTYPVPIMLGNDTNLCTSTGLILDAGATPFTYLWDNSSILRTRSVNTSGLYSVSISKQKCIVSDTISVTMGSLFVSLGNDTIICNNNSFLLDATTLGSTYQWNDGTTNATYTATNSGNHWVKIIQGSCSYSDTINIIFDSVDLKLGNDTTICFNDSLQIVPITSATNYLWSTTSTTSTIFAKNAGIYWVEVSKGGCSLRDSMQLFINNSSFNLGNDTVICGNNQLILDANSPGSTYLWNTSSTNSTILVSNSGLYYVTIMNKGCISSDSINVGFQKLNSSFIVSDTSGCEPLSVNFTDLSSINYGSIVNWNWNFGDGTFSSIQHPNKNYLTSGLFTVQLRVTSNFGCFGDTLITSLIKVNPKPNAGFLFGFNVLFSNDLIGFTNLSTQANTYFWNFGDSKTSILENPKHTYSLPGTYDVKLLAYNQFGCLDSISYQIIINEDSKVFIPNAFTPNNNGLNDGWRIHGLTEASEIEVLIFNRWGELIFKSNAINDFWDGTYEGEEAPIGGYTYKVRVKTFGIINEYFGHINLIR